MTPRLSFGNIASLDTAQHRRHDRMFAARTEPLRQNGVTMGVFKDPSVSAEVAAWFEARGLTVRISDVDYSDEVRSSPWGRRAPSRNHHVWVDLLILDGRMIQTGFGSGQSADEAMLRARDRYRVEQGD